MRIQTRNEALGFIQVQDIKFQNKRLFKNATRELLVKELTPKQQVWVQGIGIGPQHHHIPQAQRGLLHANPICGRPLLSSLKKDSHAFLARGVYSWVFE
ncbi:hypothetical protein V6N13_074061 [Hibiscus sabdariffa]|uniref:Uncharacterized protein n=1 Tax=Hibiscus sabdariffa TaxID=183260 RepID=A0ABR2U7S0_9ROSI